MSIRAYLRIGFIFLTFLSLNASAVCKNIGGAEQNSIEVGVLMEVLMPNRLPDFDSSLTVFGPVIGIPFYVDTVLISGFYGSNTGLTTFTGEFAYRLNLPTPFLRTFLFLGGHFLRYSYAPTNNAYSHFGINGGAGFRMDINKTAQGTIQAKLYSQDRSFFSLGAGFAFLL